MADFIFQQNDVTTIHDETDGLQNTPPNLDATVDDNGNDIGLGELPLEFSTRLNDLGAGTSGAIGAALSGYDGSNNGSDIFSLSGATSATNLALTGSDGNLLNGLDSGLNTIDGNDILLFTDETDDNIALGIEAGTGDIAFALYLEGTSDNTAAKLWSVQYEAISHPDNPSNYDEPVDLADKIFVTASEEESLEFDLTNAPSGQNLFIMFGDGDITDGGDEVGIVATGKNPLNQSDDPSAITSGDTVNTSKAGGPTTFGVNNQMLTASSTPGDGDGIYFTFVTNPDPDFTVPKLDQGEADSEANIQFADVLDADSATFDVVQLQGGKTAVVKLTAKSTEAEPGVDFVDGLSDDTAVDITNVQVFESDGVTPAAGVTIEVDDGMAIISGVQAGDKIEYTTNGDHNRILIENAGDGKGQDSADFDIGGFQLLENNFSSSTAEIGSNIFFEDDGPMLGPIADGTVGFIEGESTTAALNLDPGADGLQSLAILDIPDSFTLIDDRTVTSAIVGDTVIGTDSNGDAFYELVFDSNEDTYTFTLLQSPPSVVIPIDFSSVKAGGPQETLTVQNVTFDGFFLDNEPDEITSKFLDNHIDLIGDGSDDVNPNNAGGIGVGNGNIDQDEGLLIDVSNSTDPITGIQFVAQGVGGGIGSVDFLYEGYKDGVLVESGSIDNVNLGDPGTDTIDILLTSEFDELYVVPKELDGNDKLRINQVSLITTVGNPDYELTFGIGATDGDGDTTPFPSDSATFTIGIDGNLDGSITEPILV